MGPAPAIQCPKCGHSSPNGATRCPACEGLIVLETDATSTGIDLTKAFSKPVAVHSGEWQAPITPGTVIAGRYEILQSLGQGGMGAVFKAQDIELDRVVALKVIRPEFASDPKTLKRFKQELILARQITHRNVVRIFDIGTHGDIRFITMECVDGQDLSAMLEGHRFTPVEAARLIRQVCHALEAAHGENVVHRDLKPPNIMIDKAGKVLVMDFGLARSVELSNLTRTGAILGTPAYVSPEQAKGMPLDSRSDLFSLGIIFYELLTGKQPYEADTLWGLLLKRTQEPAPVVRDISPDVPEALCQIVAKCLAIDPADRYQDATELALQLDIWLDDSPLSKYLSMQGSLSTRTATAVAPPVEEPVTPHVLPQPARASRTKWWVSGIAALILIASAVFGWRAFRAAPHAPLKPETIVVADISNRTGDAVFDGTLEPVLRLSLEGAGFISAYNRSNLPARPENPTAKFDESAALRLAVSQGLGIVVAGALEQRGSSYVISARVVRAITGSTVTTATVEAGGKSDVLSAVGKLAGVIRGALGDETSETAQRFAKDTLTATSLEAVHEYASAMDALSSGRFDEARQHFTKATDLDPKFGLAWAGMASASRSLGDQKQAEKYIQLAYANIDSMTERERYRTRGLFFALTGDQRKCVEEYGALLTRYSSDVGAHNNVAICYSYLRNVPKAIEEVQKAIDILPKRAVYRFNLALYRAYSGEFDRAQTEIQAAQLLNPKYDKGYLTLAYAQLGQDRAEDAAKSYGTLATLSPRGASLASAGLADLAIYEGRFRQAIDMLRTGAQQDLEANRQPAAADKFIALADAYLAMNQKPAAVAAARQALAASSSIKNRFVVGRLLASTGETAQARVIAASLASESNREPQSYAKLVEAAIAIQERNAKQAVSVATQAVGLLDSWVAHFDLGHAFLEAKEFPQADSEFEQCIKRRGEATELFLDDVATYRHVASVYYYLGQVREGMKGSGAQSYGKYLQIRGKAGEDPLLTELRRKVGQ